MQVLLSGDWKPAVALYPTSAPTLEKMVSKGWMEHRVSTRVEYRITEAGREAFRQRLPMRSGQAGKL